VGLGVGSGVVVGAGVDDGVGSVGEGVGVVTDVGDGAGAPGPATK
jgi:hypothetical protein